jgi:hypothetical protein
MLKATLTVAILDPILNVTSPVYVPICRLALDTVIETSCVALAARLPVAGLILSQFPPSAVEAVADHDPADPQLPTVATWEAGFPCPCCIALKLSDWGAALIQGGFC